MTSIKFKILCFALLVIIQLCEGRARVYFDVNGDFDNVDSDQDGFLSDSGYNPKYNVSKTICSGTNTDEFYDAPARNVSNNVQVVDANKAKYMARLFAKCGESEYTETVCNGVIIERDTVITAAHCIYGQNFFQVCTRKENETSCPAQYDPNDKENCFVTKDIYIHPQFVQSLLFGSMCHDIAVIKFPANTFDADQVFNINFDDCLFDFEAAGLDATFVGCGSQENLDLTYFKSQVLNRTRGIDAYGDRYVQCPNLYTKTDDIQNGNGTCIANTGGALFLLKTNEDVSYDPTVDRQDKAILFGLGSFTRKNCASPSAFVAVCDYFTFIQNPRKYGVLVENANKELEGFPLAQVLQLLQTLLLDGAYISCTLQRVIKTLSAVTGLVFEDILQNLVLEKLLLSLPL